MSLKKKLWDTLFDDEITEEDGKKLDEAVESVELDEIQKEEKEEEIGLMEGNGIRTADAEKTPFTGNQTVFVEPKNYSECKKIANYIKEEKMVTVNLESLDGPNAQRILDFLSGASSIKEANFIPVSKRVYVVVPKDVDVLFDGTNKLEKKPIKILD